MLHLITEVKFILSSISNGWLFWSVSHTSMSWNSELNVFKKIWFIGEISNKLPNGLFGTSVYKTFESWQLAILQLTNTTSVISRCSRFSPFLLLVILFSVLRNNFIVSGVKSSRLYPFLILNVILFPILFTYIFTDGLSMFSPCFLKIYSK